MLSTHPAVTVLLVHATVTLALIVAGAVLVGIGAISQPTLLAMISGGVGLLSGGGTALALESAITHANGRRNADHH